MAIVTETIFINGRPFIRTHSDAGRYVVGGEPHSYYSEAIDPAEYARTYVEGDLIEVEVDAEEAMEILFGGDA